MTLPYDTSDELTAASPAGPGPHLGPPSHAAPVESDLNAHSTPTDGNADDLDDEDDERPWRGILVVELPKKVLFEKWIDISPGKLRKWKPDPIVLPPELEDDDDE